MKKLGLILGTAILAVNTITVGAQPKLGQKPVTAATKVVEKPNSNPVPGGMPAPVFPAPKMASMPSAMPTHQLSGMDMANNVAPELSVFQAEVAKIMQQLTGSFQPEELMQLIPAIQGGLNAALVSTDFDQAVDKLCQSATGVATSFGKKLELCQDLKTKLVSALEKATRDFDKLVRSNKITNVPGEIYFARMTNSVLLGLYNGVKSCAVSKEACPASTPTRTVESETPVKVAGKPGMPAMPVMPAKTVTPAPVKPELPVMPAPVVKK